MIWRDFLVVALPSRESIQRAIARTFGVAARDVVVAASIEEILHGSFFCQVICLEEGDLRGMLSVYVPDEAMALGREADLAREMGCDVFVDTDDSNPYALRLVRWQGGEQEVRLSATDLDDADSYRVIGFDALPAKSLRND
jgi:hypothetical protein